MTKPSNVDESKKRNSNLIRRYNPDDTKRRSPESKWILTSRGLFVIAPKPNQRVDLVRQRHCDAHGVGRHPVVRSLRLVMLLAGGGDGGILALRQRVVFAHQTLQFREFADHF